MELSTILKELNNYDVNKIYKEMIEKLKDEDTTNNNVENLEIQSRSEHGKHHANADPIIKYIKKNGPANKGKKMSPEFCEHCRQAALKRCAKKRTG